MKKTLILLVAIFAADFSFADDHAAAFDTALEFARTSNIITGVTMDREAAEAFAAELSTRRPTASAAAREILAFVEFYQYLVAPLNEHGLNLKPAEARADALKFAQLVPGSDPTTVERGTERLYPKDLAIRYAIEIDAKERSLQTKLSGRPFGPGDKFAIMALVHLNQPRTASANWVHGFKEAFEFSRRSVDDAGLALSVDEAAANASEIVTRRGSRARGEIRAYETLFREFSNPAFSSVVVFSHEQAQARALLISKGMTLPSAEAGVLYSKVLRQMFDFLATPIRDGGLGYDPARVEAEVSIWAMRFELAIAANIFVRSYKVALYTRLERMILEGNYDEIAARDWALDLLKSFGSLGEMYPWFKKNGYVPYMSHALPKRPGHDDISKAELPDVPAGNKACVEDLSP